MEDKRFHSIQALRGVAILLVLARHLVVMEGHFGGGESLLPDILKAGDGGVDLFFVISGFIMVVISPGKFQLPGAIGSFLYKRATRIYPLYWLYSFVILLVYLVSPAWVPAVKKGHVDLIASVFLFPQRFPPLLGQGWTLTHEAYFYLMFALALLLPERRLPRFLLIWGLGVALGYSVYTSVGTQSDIAAIKMITNPVTIEFVLGACVALAVRRGFRRADSVCLIAGSLLLPATSLLFDPLEVEGLRFFCFGLPALLILYGAVSLETRSRFPFPRWLSVLGDASYSIYLSHILVITAVGRVWSLVRQRGLWDNALAILVMIAAAIGCGLASYHFVERPLLRILQNWGPERRTSPFPTVASVAAK